MYRWLAVAALGAALTAAPVWGQRRGGGAGSFGGHGGFASHSSFASHSGMGSRGFGFSGSVRGPAFGGGFNRPFFHHPHFGTSRRYLAYPGYYGYPYYGYPYYGYPSYYDNWGYETSDSYADDGGYAPVQGDQQQAEIDRLEDEVNRLRRQRSTETKSQVPSKTDLFSLTELVFQDKHTREVQNYAIVGETFWVFDGPQSRKIPLSELDVAATIKANDARGVDFQVPR